MKTDNVKIAAFVGGEHNEDVGNPYMYDKYWDALIPALEIAKERIKAAGWGTPTEKEAWKRFNAALNEVYNLNIKNAHYCFVKFIDWYTSQTLKK
jgi:hypothetical protein